MDGFEYLHWESSSQGVGVVWLARPPVNAVNEQMYREIEVLFEDTSVLGKDIKVIVLAGEGEHFCAGNDLKEFSTMTPANCGARMTSVRAAFFAIQGCDIPVIAAVHGAALGTGLAIAASCDFIVAAEDARIGVPEIGVGVMGGARHLARLLPEPLVRLLYLTGEPLPVQDFARLGGVVAVVPSGQLLKEARALAAKVARHSHVAIRAAKRSLNHIEEMDLRPGYEFEQELTCELCGHPDSVEAVRAAIERREPRYLSNAVK
jgi:enoyl-CoA hydratase